MQQAYNEVIVILYIFIVYSLYVYILKCIYLSALAAHCSCSSLAGWSAGNAASRL